MPIIKSRMYFSKFTPEQPEANHNGVCQNPHKTPTIKADRKGEYFFWSSFRAKPLHPNCSPKGPLTKLSKNAISNNPKLVNDNAMPGVPDAVDSSNITTTVIIT